MSHEKLTEAQIDAAAKWWKERLRKPKFQLLTEAERRDPRESGAAFAEVLATVTHKDLTDEQLDRFEEELKAGLRALETPPYCIAVDYHPDAILGDAAERAGIKCGMMITFPPKTRMYFEAGRVSASCGYGVAPEVILGRKRV